MARYSKEEINRSPIHPQIENRVLGLIDSLGTAQLRLAKYPFTFDDLRNLFVPKNQHSLVTDAFDLAAPPGTTFELIAAVEKFALSFNWRSDTEGGFLIPKTSGHNLVSDCPPPLREQCIQTFHELQAISYNFGRAIWVFRKLNNKNYIRTPMGVRMFWPCIVPLLERLKEPLETQLREFNPRWAFSPTLPPELTQDDVRETNETIARAFLVEASGAEEPKLPVRYHVVSVPWFGKFVGIYG